MKVKQIKDNKYIIDIKGHVVILTLQEAQDLADSINIALMDAELTGTEYRYGEHGHDDWKRQKEIDNEI
jgi:hypothetical protein